MKTKKCVLTSIPYGENVVYLCETAAEFGAKKILLTGSVGGFSYSDMPISVGDLVAPTKFVDYDGSKKDQLKIFLAKIRVSQIAAHIVWLTASPKKMKCGFWIDWKKK